MSDGAESKEWIYAPRTRLREVTAGGGGVKGPEGTVETGTKQKRVNRK